MNREPCAPSGDDEAQIDAALAECTAALAAMSHRLLGEEAPELLDIGEEIRELRHLPALEEWGTVYGGLTSFACHFAGMAKLAAGLGRRAADALGADAPETTSPTLN